VHEQAVTDGIVETAKNRANVIRSTRQFEIWIFIHALDQFFTHFYLTDGQLQFAQGGTAAILMLLNAMNHTINGLDQRLNGLDQRFNRIEVMMENARIVKRNQHLRSLGPGQVYNLRRKEVSIFAVLHWVCSIDVIYRSLALERF